ncbi:hypothetical protein D3C73_1218650 [compost metagenome]
MTQRLVPRARIQPNVEEGAGKYRVVDPPAKLAVDVERAAKAWVVDPGNAHSRPDIDEGFMHFIGPALKGGLLWTSRSHATHFLEAGLNQRVPGKVTVIGQFERKGLIPGHRQSRAPQPCGVQAYAEPGEVAAAHQASIRQRGTPIRPSRYGEYQQQQPASRQAVFEKASGIGQVHQHLGFWGKSIQD